MCKLCEWHLKSADLCDHRYNVGQNWLYTEDHILTQDSVALSSSYTGMLSLSFLLSFLQMYTLIHTDQVSFEMPFGEQMGFQLQPNQTQWGTDESGQRSDRSKGLGVKDGATALFHPHRTLSRRFRNRGEEGCWGLRE